MFLKMFNNKTVKTIVFSLLKSLDLAAMLKSKKIVSFILKVGFMIEP